MNNSVVGEVGIKRLNGNGKNYNENFLKRQIPYDFPYML